MPRSATSTTSTVTTTADPPPPPTDAGCVNAATTSARCPAGPSASSTPTPTPSSPPPPPATATPADHPNHRELRWDGAPAGSRAPVAIEGSGRSSVEVVRVVDHRQLGPRLLQVAVMRLDVAGGAVVEGLTDE